MSNVTTEENHYLNFQSGVENVETKRNSADQNLLSKDPSSIFLRLSTVVEDLVHTWDGVCRHLTVESTDIFGVSEFRFSPCTSSLTSLLGSVGAERREGVEGRRRTRVPWLISKIHLVLEVQTLLNRLLK